MRTTRSASFTALPAALLVAACAGAPPAATPEPLDAEQQAVLAVVERYFEAMSARDLATMDEILVPEAMTMILVADGENTGALHMRTRAEGRARLAAAEERWAERIYDPVVLVHAPIAHVWTGYDFYIDGEHSHCGANAIDLMQVDGAWKLTSASWTVETQSCEPPTPEDPARVEASRTAVLDAVDRFFVAMKERDIEAYAAALVPEATYFTRRITADGPGPVRMRTGAEDLAGMRTGTERLEEWIFDPVVLVRGPLAVLWAPYLFHVDGRFSHCGVDIFQMARLERTWKMTNASWTVETEGCTETGPAKPALGGRE
jgi:ketosteroid isomerase-like protein